ncbi:MAG: oxidoreductase [Bacteroidetes bacterium]|nr:oxidoreductase [Bacteroidota bacterium]
MEKRVLGKGGPELTTVGFGAWAIGGPWIYGWGAVDDRESVAAIRRSLDLGVNWIDTAAAYGLGHSEEVVAKAVEGMSPRPFISTKCGLVPDGKGDVYRNSKPDSIRAEAEASLRRLKTDCIDLYQIHWHDESVPVEDAWGTLVRLREEGKVRYIGVSNYDVPLLQRCLKVAPVQSLQPPYSLLARHYEKETLPFCAGHGIGVIVYSPMQSGLLTGRFDLKKLAPDDWRHKISLFRDPELSQALEFVDDLRPIAARYRKTVGQLAVAWVLRNHAVTSAIVGARNESQVGENAGSAGWRISDADYAMISELYWKHYK